MRCYCLLSTKKDVTYFGEGSDAYETLFKGIQYRMDTNELIQSGLLEFFSPEEAKQIIKASELPAGTVTRLDGKSIHVPVPRLRYLPLLTLILGVSFAFANPMSAKSASLFGYEITADQMLFPCVYIFTDLINELFGYETARRCIRCLVCLLFPIAGVIQLALFLEPGDTISATLFSDATSDDIIRGFWAIYNGFPQRLLIDAICLLVADNLNAYLFTQLKNFMRGKKLWFRSLCSNLFAATVYVLVFFVLYQLCCWELPSPETMSYSHTVVTIAVKLPYFIAFLPIIYGIRNYIYNQEAKTLANMGHVDLLDD